MREYEFVARFYDTYGSFSVDADNEGEAYDKAIETIKKETRDLPFAFDFDVECIDSPDEDDEDDEDE